MLFFIAPTVAIPQMALYSQAQSTQAQIAQSSNIGNPHSIPAVPFYSQFKNITSPKWQKVGCGITSLAMIIDFYKADTVSVNTLLGQGLAAGAYDMNGGWIASGLIQLSRTYGLDGIRYDLSNLNSANAFNKFTNFLKDGPVIAAVHYKFDPKSTIPHLVVIDGFDNGVIYYNDPAAKMGEKTISVANFLRGWKKKIIVIRPKQGTSENVLTFG